MAEPGGGPVTTEGWAAILTAALATILTIARQIVKSRLPKRGPAPDPVAGFDRLADRLQQQVDGLTEENRHLRADMDNRARECAEQLDVLADEVARLRALLARHGMTGESGL